MRRKVVDWIHPTPEWGKWRALLKTAMKLRDRKDVRNFSSGTSSFSRTVVTVHLDETKLEKIHKLQQISPTAVNNTSDIK